MTEEDHRITDPALPRVGQTNEEAQPQQVDTARAAHNDRAAGTERVEQPHAHQPAPAQHGQTPVPAQHNHRPASAQHGQTPHFRPAPKGEAHTQVPHQMSAHRSASGKASGKDPGSGKRFQSVPTIGSGQRRGKKSALKPLKRRSPYGSLRKKNVSRKDAIAAASIGLAAVLGLGGVGSWWAFWRSIRFTVNGKSVSARVGTPLAQMLHDHDYFGAKPGPLKSVGGALLDETGGPRCSVTIDGSDVPFSELSTYKVASGASITVSDGAEGTEEYTEEKVAIQPVAEMQRGGAIQYVAQWGKPGEKLVRTGKTSGEVVDHEILTEVQNMVVASKSCVPEDGGKYMALTFDDGPSSFTPQILDILKEKGVKATFFNLGNNVDAHPELTRRVHDEGHQLASHSTTHPVMTKLDRDAMRKELTSVAQSLKESAGVDVQMLRAPYGAYDLNCWLQTNDLISCNVLWNIDTLDWKRPGADKIVQSVLAGANNGAIALMHDGGGERSQDIEALPKIIDGLREAGYELVTVQELMKLDGGFPEDVVKGSVKPPKDAVIPEHA
ncbi:polysaccharide deacetylase family protein [Collinsella sp. AGMB00827]|uniref:Polysaccharide deacetylase family protein n=1 Tax=Collinsella ureilytica TaxID=2869515 RepID=A0ABS7MKF8_9ACTN|nr:polysaccharide deacetylase family protein [Collinsella urealyticum]MBY4797853.1 polysaccharide deacetylase family protein [Collinsella urealyticum]